MTMDYGATPQNFDFQDNVWLVTNIRPVTVTTGIAAPQTSAAPAAVVDLNAIATTGGNQLQWAPISDTNLQGYNIYSSSSLAGPYSLLNIAPITGVTYLDTAAATTGTSYYQVTAVDSALGTASLAASTSIVNTIGNGTIGDGMPVGLTETVTTRLAHPLVISEVAGSTDNAYGTLLPRRSSSPRRPVTAQPPSTPPPAQLPIRQHLASPAPIHSSTPSATTAESPPRRRQSRSRLPPVIRLARISRIRCRRILLFLSTSSPVPAIPAGRSSPLR